MNLTLLKEKLDAIIKTYTSTDGNPCAVPGLAIVVRNRTDEIYVGQGGDLTVDTPGALASVSKLITPLVYLKAVEQGLIGLDDPLQPILGTDVDLSHVIEEADPRVLSPPNAPVTLRNACSHTSGLQYKHASSALQKYHKLTSDEAFHQEFNIGLPKNFGPLVAQPNQRWIYSTGLDVAGVAIQNVTGQSLEALVQTQLCQPLHLQSTSFHAPLGTPPTMYHRKAVDGHSEWIQGPYFCPVDPVWYSGGGGLFSTAREVAIILACLLNAGRPILEHASVDAYFTNVAAGNTKIEQDIEEETLAWAFPGRDYKPWKKGYGLGCMLDEEQRPDTKRSKGTAMWCGISGTYAIIDRQEGLVCSLMLQIFLCDDVMYKIHHEVEKAIYECL